MSMGTSGDVLFSRKVVSVVESGGRWTAIGATMGRLRRILGYGVNTGPIEHLRV